MATLLIIEDDPYVQRFYRQLFTFEKFTVELASDGIEGIEKAKKLLPDLILLDIMMPKLNGLDTLKILKKEKETRNIQVIMLSNFGEEQYVKDAVQLGASAFLIKASYSPDQLLAAVRKYVGEGG